MKSRAGYYKIEIEEVNNTVTFLDLKLWFSANRMVVAPVFKSTAHTIPLSTSSAHSPAVHASWPRSMARRIKSLTSSSDLATLAHMNLEDQYRSNLADRFTLEAFQTGVVCTVSQRRPVTPSTVWLKLGFHPVLYRSVQHAIRQVAASHGLLLRILGIDLDVRISWRNALPSLVCICKVGRVGR